MKRFLRYCLAGLCAILLFAGGFYAGRYTAPVKYRYEETNTFYGTIDTVKTEKIFMHGLDVNDEEHQGDFCLRTNTETKVFWNKKEISASSLNPGELIAVTYSGNIEKSELWSVIEPVHKITVLREVLPETQVLENTKAERYYMECIDLEDQDLTLPCLTLFEDGTFSFSYDLLSSYYPYGTYEKSEEEIIAKTSDKKYSYVFQILDDNTLKFIQERSSDVSLTQDNSGAAITDGALFIRQ